MTRRLILALAPAVALAAAAAQAQPAPDAPRPMHGQPSAEMRARHEAMQQQRLEDLKTVLRLRPDQQPALEAFVAAHHPPDRREPPKAGEDGPRTTPERLDAMAKREAEMAAEHARMRDALAKFYAALSADQQKVFDALMRLQHGGMRGGMHDGHGRRGFRGGGGFGGPMMGHGPG
jgi:hypothetical protein